MASVFHAVRISSGCTFEGKTLGKAADKWSINASHGALSVSMHAHTSVSILRALDCNMRGYGDSAKQRAFLLACQFEEVGALQYATHAIHRYMGQILRESDISADCEPEPKALLCLDDLTSTAL